MKRIRVYRYIAECGRKHIVFSHEKCCKCLTCEWVRRDRVSRCIECDNSFFDDDFN